MFFGRGGSSCRAFLVYHVVSGKGWPGEVDGKKIGPSFYFWLNSLSFAVEGTWNFNGVQKWKSQNHKHTV